MPYCRYCFDVEGEEVSTYKRCGSCGEGFCRMHATRLEEGDWPCCCPDVDYAGLEWGA